MATITVTADTFQKTVEKDGIVANNQVKHTSSQPSYIVLPIVK